VNKDQKTVLLEKLDANQPPSPKFAEISLSKPPNQRNDRLVARSPGNSLVFSREPALREDLLSSALELAITHGINSNVLLFEYSQAKRLFLLWCRTHEC
jgi:hypothetical protein